MLFPLSAVFSNAIIAPFWEDSDNANGGEVFYRITDEQSILDEITLNISSAFGVDFAPSTAFIATWDQLPQFGGPTDVVNKRNIALSCIVSDFLPLFGHKLIVGKLI